MDHGKKGKKTGERTPYPGVYRLDARTYRIRGEWRSPKTGYRQELDRIVTAASAEQAAVIRSQMRAERMNAAPARKRLRVDDFATSWLEAKAGSIKESSRAHYAATLDLYISPTFGAYFVDAVTPDDVRAWLARQRGTAQTVNGRLRVLRMLLSDAARELRIVDPTAHIKGPRIVREEHDHKVLEASELLALLAWLRERTVYHPIALTLALTGMRYGEAAALRWSDVDFDAGTIRISRGFYRGQVGTPKTGKARTVPLPSELAEVLRARRADQVRKQAAGLAGGWVFASESTGEPVRQVGLAEALKRAGKALKLERRPTPHSFRHTFNDLLRRVTTGEVQRAIVGHSSAKMSEHYSHVGIAERKAATSAVLAHLHAPERAPGFHPGSTDQSLN